MSDDPRGAGSPPDGEPRYGEAPYGQDPYGRPARRSPGGTNGFAIASLVLSFFIPLLGLIFGYIAKSQIRRTGQAGGGLATAGLVISWLEIVIAIAVIASD